MAKARRARREGQDKVLTKKQIARTRKVARQQRLIWSVVAGVTALILLVFIVGLVQEYVVGPRRPVATVDGDEISRVEYQTRVRYDQWDLQFVEQNLLLQQASYDPNDASQQFLYQYLDSQIQQVRQQQISVPYQALEDLIDEALVRQEAERRGLVVLSDEVQQFIERQFGYDRNPPEPTPTPITSTVTLTPTTPIAPATKEQFEEDYGRYVEVLESAVRGFSEEDYRHLVQQDLLRQSLSEALSSEVPTTDEHVHAYHILVEDEATATEVLEKLNAGVSFADLVSEYSQDENTVDQGGELGWLAADQSGFSVTLVGAAFDLESGQFSEAIETSQGYHVVTIDERRTDYPLDEATLSSRQARAFSDWLAEARQMASIERTWSLDDVPPE